MRIRNRLILLSLFSMVFLLVATVASAGVYTTLTAVPSAGLSVTIEEISWKPEGYSPGDEVEYNIYVTGDPGPSGGTVTMTISGFVLNFALGDHIYDGDGNLVNTLIVPVRPLTAGETWTATNPWTIHVGGRIPGGDTGGGGGGGTGGGGTGGGGNSNNPAVTNNPNNDGDKDYDDAYANYLKTGDSVALGAIYLTAGLSVLALLGGLTLRRLNK